MKKVFDGKVISNMLLAEDIYSMEIELPHMGAPRPGQFVNIYLDDKSLLLPRPISICDFSEGVLRLVYKSVGKGTELMSKYASGDGIKVSSPLGNGYMLNTSDGGLYEEYKGRDMVMVGGGIGIPPMLLLGKKLKALGANVSAVLGFPSETFLIEDFEEVFNEVHVATDDGSTGFKGNVVQLVMEHGIKGDEFFCCGPKPMLRGLNDYCTGIGSPCQVSLEERMGCGYGACVGCVCKIKSGEETELKKVCKHGPVFFGSEVIWDE